MPFVVYFTVIYHYYQSLEDMTSANIFSLSAKLFGTFFALFLLTCPGLMRFLTFSFANFVNSSELSCGCKPILAASPPMASDIFCIFIRMPPNITINSAKSSSVLPAPFTILFLLLSAVLEATNMSGYCLSSGVMDMISDFATLNDCSASCMSLSDNLFAPGIIFMSCDIDPMSPITSMFFKKSSKLNVAFIIFSFICSASSCFTASFAFSTNETTSPIPKILLVILSG
mmetsp:Transcript_3126/g.9640  ORF Transcript_3126/g.9640 Transcript_3126/m.9640 type:complete len:229 (+) Transcript_3126:1782-2468(+)